MSTSLSPTDFADAAACYSLAVGLLGRGVVSSRHAFHLLTASTIGLDGSPSARIVVIRHLDSPRRRLCFQTDVRSAKITELRADPRIALVGYDPESRVQLRLRARATIHVGDPLARDTWATMTTGQRAVYNTPFASSAELPTGVELPEPTPPDETDTTPFENFAVIECEYHEIDVLWLRLEGHLRGRLTWADGRFQLTRLCP